MGSILFCWEEKKKERQRGRKTNKNSPVLNFLISQNEIHEVGGRGKMTYYSHWKSTWFLQVQYCSVLLGDQTFTGCLSRMPEINKFESLGLCVYSRKFLFSFAIKERMISDAEKENPQILCVIKYTIIDQSLLQTQGNFR